MENQCALKLHMWITGRLSQYTFSSLITNIKNIYTSEGFKFTSCNAKSLWIETRHKDTSQTVWASIKDKIMNTHTFKSNACKEYEFSHM